MSDFLSFRRMITPIVITVLFWIGVVGAVIAGLVMLVAGQDTQTRIMGFFMIFLGPLAVRIYCELLMVIFRINDTLTDCYHVLAHGSAPAVPAATHLASPPAAAPPSAYPPPSV